MYYIVYHNKDGFGYHAIIDESGKPNMYGKKKLFKTIKQAQQWIDKKQYPYMTHYYTINKGNDVIKVCDKFYCKG